MPSLPSEDEVWEWLGELNLTDDETHELKYIEREIIEKKVYVCMKEESGADWLAGKFEEGQKFQVSQGQEVMIKGRKEGEQWLEVVVRGVYPETEVKVVEDAFKQFGDVKEVAFVTFGPKKVKSNKINLKVKLVEGKSLPGFVMAPIGEGGMERWEVTSKGPGGPKVCLHCYQPGHIRKQCRNQAPTMAEVVEGKAGGAISYAQVLAGTKAAKPVVPPPPPRQPPSGTKAQTIARVSNANSMENPNPTLNATGSSPMPVGPVTGNTVSKPLISSVAATTQELETPAADQILALPAAELVKQAKNGEEDEQTVEEEIEKLQSEVERLSEGKKKKEKVEKKRKEDLLRDEKRDSESRERKRKSMEDRSQSGERGRSNSEKRRREREIDRKTRQDHPPHQSQHGKHSDRPPSRNNGSHN